MIMDENWKHIKTVLDSESFEVKGLNIWDLEWKTTGESIKIKDPKYGQCYTFSVYQITRGSETVRFSAGEFSNNIWGIYIEQNP
ncbi:hypothetical protein KFE98_00445 [bacterium SCSIO 12741]|nr:hypothetical protein KFE98_00445 [bacterium SCSIO 12741]